MMRIALNLIGFVPGYGGMETYVTSLLAALQRVDGENEYLVLCDEVAVPALKLSADNFALKVFAHQKYSARWIARGVVNRLCGYDMLVGELNRVPVDLIHHPLTVLNPRGLSRPSVLTFHDMQQEYFPEFFTGKELAGRSRSYRASALEARAVIAISGHVAQGLAEKYGVEARKVHVVHSGCSEEFRPRDRAELSGTAAKYADAGPFLLYPAGLWPHKNHVRLLEALRLLVDRGAFDGSVLFTGAQLDARRELTEAIARLDLSARVRWLGYLPKQELVELYNVARMVAFPSLFEGFGLPVLEAMASGCPVACSRTTSLPEVGGDAVLYFDPLQVEDIAAQVSRVWNDEALAHDLAARGLRQAERFTWDETARGTVEVYRAALAGR